MKNIKLNTKFEAMIYIVKIISTEKLNHFHYC